MIVDGTDQFVGNDSARAFRAIAQAARTPKLVLTLSAIALNGAKLTGAVSIAPPATQPLDADIYAAVVESMASIQVLRGENGGRTLHHVSVVRDMQKVGSLREAIGAPVKFSLNAPSDAPAADFRVVVFIQRNGQGAILGAISSPTPSVTSVAAAASPQTR
jgi:hypothetical protein